MKIKLTLIALSALITTIALAGPKPNIPSFNPLPEEGPSPISPEGALHTLRNTIPTAEKVMQLICKIKDDFSYSSGRTFVEPKFSQAQIIAELWLEVARSTTPHGGLFILESPDPQSPEMILWNEFRDRVVDLSQKYNGFNDDLGFEGAVAVLRMSLMQDPNFLVSKKFIDFGE